MPYVPEVNFDQLSLYIGSCATGRATAGSTTLDTVVFAQLPGQPARPTFTAADVGKPIAIVGAGPVNPLMPITWYVQGATFVTTIAAYISPDEVMLTDAPVTDFFNTGFYNIIMYSPCEMSSDQSVATPAFQFSSSISPGTRDTLIFSVIARDNKYLDRFSVICNGQPVYASSLGNSIGIQFGGYIDTLTILSYPGVEDVFSYQATCVSWAGLATRRQVPPQIAQTMTGAGDEVFAKVVLAFLQNDGVAVSAESAPTITLPCAAGAPVNQLLDQIVQLISTPLSSWYWYTDEWRTFILKQRTSTAAPWNVEDGSELLSGAAPYQQSIQTTHNQMANYVYGVATKVLLNALNVTFQGDGSSRTFNLPQPVGNTPTIALNGHAQTVGIQGVDTGFEWYWAEGSSVITQDAASTVLEPTDQLIVAYSQESPGVAQAPNGPSLIALQPIEGTAAEYDYTFNINTPINPEILLDLANGYETSYGNPATTCTLYTLIPGLATGQLQSITLPAASISGSFLIATVQVTVDHNVLVWQYTAFGGANIGDSITGLVQFINRGQTSAGITKPVPVITVGYHEITIDHTKIVGSDKTNFVFFFGGVYEWLTGPPGGNVAYANGSDIFFSSDRAGSEVLDFDLEMYDSGTGQIAAWVRIPTVSHTVDTVIYIQYGDTAQSSTLENPHGVWSPAVELSGTPNDNYRAVLHLAESTAPYQDATKYGSNSVGDTGSGYPTRVAGPFAYAMKSQTPGTQGIQIPNCIVGDGFANYSASLECWMSMPAGSGSSTYYQDVFDAQVSTSFGYGLAVAVVTHTACGVINYDGAQHKFPSAAVVDDGLWHYIVLTMSASNAYLYVDGALVATAGVGQNMPMSGSTPIEVSGTRGGLSFVGWNGSLAEPHVTQAVLDGDTIATNWANQSSPQTFYALGATTSGATGQTTNVLGNPGGTVTHSTGALTGNAPVFGAGGGDIKVGTKTGTTNQVQCSNGAAGAAGAPLLYDASGNAIAGTAGQLVPSGGAIAQVLAKASGTDGDTHWVAGGGSSPLTTKGDLFGFDTADARIPVGSNGQVLTADSTQTLGVKWAAGGGGSGGDLIFLGSVTASGSAELDLTSLISSTYDTYFVVLQQLVPSASGQPLLLQFSSNNGVSYDVTSGNYCWAYQFGNIPGAANNTESSTSDVGIVMAVGQLDSATVWGGISGTFYIHNPLGGTYTQVDGNFTAKDNRDGQGSNRSLCGYHTQAVAVNAFRFRMAGSANIATGIARVYGLTH